MMYKSPAHKRLNMMRPTMEEGGAGKMGTPELTAKYA